MRSQRRGIVAVAAFPTHLLLLLLLLLPSFSSFNKISGY